MHRLRNALILVTLAAFVAGCDGVDQPNKPAQAGDVNADFGKNAMDLMKKANSGMTPKKKSAK